MTRISIRSRFAIAALGALFLAAPVAAVMARTTPTTYGIVLTKFAAWEVPVHDLSKLGAGAPSIIVKAFSPGMNVVKYLDTAWANHQQVVLYFTDTVDYGSGRVYTNRIAPWVSQVKHHPAVYGYLSVKEPSWSGVTLSEMRSLYSAFKAADPNHMVAALLGDTPHFGESQNPWGRGVADMLWVDWYPVTCTTGYLPGAKVNFPKVRSYVDATTPGTKIWLVTQGHKYTPGNRCTPTAAQLDRQVREGQVYLKADGFVFYTWTNGQYQMDYLRNPGLWSHAKWIVNAVRTGSF